MSGALALQQGLRQPVKAVGEIGGQAGLLSELFSEGGGIVPGLRGGFVSLF